MCALCVASVCIVDGIGPIAHRTKLEIPAVAAAVAASEGAELARLLAAAVPYLAAECVRDAMVCLEAICMALPAGMGTHGRR